MVSEVLREKPDSAKAHLFNAYLLAHVDHSKVAANEELNNVVRLDHKGDVKSSALFGRTVAELDAPTAKVAPGPKPQMAYATPAQDNTGIVVLFICGVLIIVLIVYLMNKPPKIVTVTNTEYIRERRDVVEDNGNKIVVTNGTFQVPPVRSPAPVVFTSPPYRRNGDDVQGGYTAQATRQPMGAMGTAASVAGGVVAGNLLSNALLHNNGRGYDNRTNTYDDVPAERASRVEQEPTPTRSYEVERSSYSSGSSSSYDSDSSSSSSNSSWDSGSSSSDSGGGSDW